MSIKDYDDEKKDVTIKHYRIRKMDNGGCFISPKKTFNNMIELIEHYKGKIYCYFMNAVVQHLLAYNCDNCQFLLHLIAFDNYLIHFKKKVDLLKKYEFLFLKFLVFIKSSFIAKGCNNNHLSYADLPILPLFLIIPIFVPITKL